MKDTYIEFKAAKIKKTFSVFPAIIIMWSAKTLSGKITSIDLRWLNFAAGVLINTKKIIK